MGAKIISSHFNVLPSLEHGWQKAGTHLNREDGGGEQMRAGERRERGILHFREFRVSECFSETWGLTLLLWLA